MADIHLLVRQGYQSLKNIYHFFQAHFWRAYYRFPDKGLSLYGVTGTNGKTTTCYLLASILRAQHGVQAVGMLTTVAFWFGEREEINATKMTALQSRRLYRYLRAMRESGVQYVVVEITSHALDQHRIAGITLKGAIILNLAREHLDYHLTMDRYAAAKSRLVGYLEAGAPLVVNSDDTWVRRMVDYAKKRRTLSGAVHWFTRSDVPVASVLPGEWNKQNVVAASLLAREMGIPQPAIERGVAAVRQVPGRMQWIDADTGFRILIDYAVTPDALEQLYTYVREQTRGRVLAVLGACGLRDRGKRPEMARVVAQHADELVLTREDPWTESEEQIFSDLEQGLGDARIPWQKIIGRREALLHMLRAARPGDIVVVTGKGAEQGMAIGKTVVPWDEKSIILDLLKQLRT